MAKTSEAEAVRIMQLAGFIPQEEFKGGDYPWKCVCTQCGREVTPRFRQVRDRGYGCKFCAGLVVDPEEAIKFIKLKNFLPLEKFPGAAKKWKIQCQICGLIVTPKLSQMKNRDTGCKNCENIKLGRKRRLDNNPESLKIVLDKMRKANLEPLEPYQLSTSKWKCRCLKCNKIVTPTYDKIRSGAGGCKYCSYSESIGRGRLDESLAVAVMLEKNLKPTVPYPGAMKPWLSECLKCGNIVKPRYAQIQQGRGGCKKCGYEKNAERARKSQTEAFRVARELGFEPLEPYVSRHKPWKCKCTKCNRIVSPHFGRLAIGGGCKFCSRTEVVESEAIALMRSKGLEPQVKYPGSGKPWLCKCTKCNREVSPRYATVNSRIGGCKYCANYGYNFSAGGILYLITNEEFGAHKIGITNDGAKEKRLEKHLKRGWKLFATEFYEDGNMAFEVEQRVLEWIHLELGLGVYLSASEMPQGGHTETVDAQEVDLVTIWKKVKTLTKTVIQESRRPNKPRTTMPKKGSRLNP